ncbi:MAG: alkylhydroperoxidase family enzyme [Acidimicrobiales bacterium]
MLLGRAAGLTEEKLAHLADTPLPEGVYEEDEAAIVRYSQASTRMEPITDQIYSDLRVHFSEKQIIEICFTVGMSNTINRFHATFLTDLDSSTREAVEATCPIPFPTQPSEQDHS